MQSLRRCIAAVLPVSLQAFLDRYQQRSRASRRTADMRASVFPIPLPKPGERA